MNSNPFGCMTMAPTPAAKKTLLAQRNLRVGKFVTPTSLDRDLLEQIRANNPDMLMIYRHYFGNEGNPGNLKDPEGRARAIVEAVTPVADLIDICETGYNEEFEGVNNHIRDLAQAEMRVANRIKAGLHGMKVAGLCCSVGTPYNDVTKGEFQDFEAYAAAFSVLDYWMPHEYGYPALNSDIVEISGRRYGARVLRYRYVIDWAQENDVALPPIIIGEFGLDGGGAGKGFKSYEAQTEGYMNQARTLAPLFMRDIQDGFLAGVCFFCVGQEDDKSWGSFDLAGESEFEALLAEDFGTPPAPRTVPVQSVSAPTKNVADAAKALGVPVSRVEAVQAVESAGRAFGVSGKALIRFEAHLCQDRLTDEERKEWDLRFRVDDDGIEWVADGDSGWEKLQAKDQAGRWIDLVLAVAVARRKAFECTSMGMFQILGEHYKRLGYLAAESMLLQFSHSEDAQWHGFVKFIESDIRLHNALKDGDAETFALVYNGNVKLYADLLRRNGWQ